MRHRADIVIAFIVLSALFTFERTAFAEEGAISAEGGGGYTGLLLPAPYASKPNTTPGAEPVITAGVRYAATDHIDLTLSGFYEPEVSYFHNGTVTVTERGAFSGTLAHTLTRFGGTAGARFSTGRVWRLTLGAEAGWSRRLYSGFDAIDDRHPTAVVSYGLSLPDQTIDNLSLAVVAGIEWLAGDHWSIALLPKAFALVGRQPTFGVVVPLSVSWAWYL